jgi:uncharacterized protein YdeI (YjbR/CyaY-like superfamily)
MTEALRSLSLGKLSTVSFEQRKAWAAWLRAHHATSPGVWLRLARKGAGAASLSYAEALEEALRYGWIDGQKRGGDDRWWLQRFAPRGPRSIWSKINRQKAEELMARGRMTAAGLAAVERARRDGRWDAAYDSPRTAAPPPELVAALEASPRAAAFFATLDGRNRYAILYRIQTAKKPETHAARIARFVGMLARKQKLHP